jgi:hypothetical protein
MTVVLDAGPGDGMVSFESIGGSVNSEFARNVPQLMCQWCGRKRLGIQPSKTRLFL